MADYYLHKTAAHIDELLEKVEGLNNYDDTEVRGLINNKVDKVTGKGLSTNDFTDAYKTELDGLDTALNGKVDKEIGKGLSTNDYTTSEKTKLNGIESGANVNVQVDWNQTDITADDYIKNKPVIPDAQIQSDWNQTNAESKDFIKNKPTFGSAASKNYTASVTSDSNDLVTSGAVYSAVSVKADLVDGKVPSSQLPSYVDDVVEYVSTSAFPETGESGKIYIAQDTNKTYRWGGSAYVEISESLALGETASTAYPGNKGKANADAIAKKPGEITTGKQYVIGGQTVTAGTGAEAFNDLTTNKAAGEYSHAEGVRTTASGANSHVEGVGTTASGPVGHAEGSGSIASGYSSHAEGTYAIASGYYSHAEGFYTIAASVCQHAQGKYNVRDTNDAYAYIIGNGTADNARHNAFAIDWNGLIYVNGSETGVDVSALAPQSTTYTKDEVDTALALKANTADIGTAATADTTTSITSGGTGLPTSGTVYTDQQTQNSEIGTLVDRGAKNLAKFDIWAKQCSLVRGTKTIGSDGAITITATSSDCYTLFGSNDFPVECRIPVTPGQEMVATWTASETGSGNKYLYIFPNGGTTGSIAVKASDGIKRFTVPENCTYITWRIGCSTSGDTLTINNLMICTAADYDASSAHVPYAPTNRKLFVYQSGYTAESSNGSFSALLHNAATYCGVDDSQDVNGFVVFTSATASENLIGFFNFEYTRDVVFSTVISNTITYASQSGYGTIAVTGGTAPYRATVKFL